MAPRERAAGKSFINKRDEEKKRARQIKRPRTFIVGRSVRIGRARQDNASPDFAFTHTKTRELVKHLKAAVARISYFLDCLVNTV